MVSESLTVSAERENLSRVQEFVISVMKKGCASREAKQLADSVEYEYADGFNILRLKKIIA